MGWGPQGPKYFYTHNIYIPAIWQSSTIFVRLIDINLASTTPADYGTFVGDVVY